MNRQKLVPVWKMPKRLVLIDIRSRQDDLKLNEPVGKRLNFVLQEMNREANTIASKANEIRITSAAISLKEEIEKLREMIQNVE